MGSRIKRRQSTGFTDIIQENISPGKKRIPQQITILQHETGR